jgi:Dirigent-like protein
MDAAVAEKVNPIPTRSQCSCTSTPVTGFPQLLEVYFCLYTHQIWNGANTNDVLTVDPNIKNHFGQIRSDDWPLLDGPPGPNAKLVGRIQGQHTLSNTETWKLAFNIIFQDDRYIYFYIYTLAGFSLLSTEVRG